MTGAESAPLLNYLFAHSTRPEFICRNAGARATLTMGTIAARSTTRSTTTTASAANFTAHLRRRDSRRPRYTPGKADRRPMSPSPSSPPADAANQEAAKLLTPEILHK